MNGAMTELAQEIIRSVRGRGADAAECTIAEGEEFSAAHASPSGSSVAARLRTSS